VYIDGSVGIDRKIEEEGIVQTEVAKRCERSAFQAVRESGHWERLEEFSRIGVT